MTANKPLLLAIRVTTKAKQPCIYAENEMVICKVNTPPVDGKANKSVIEMLADALKIPKTQIMLHSGHSSRNKVLAIFAQTTLAEIFARLGSNKKA